MAVHSHLKFFMVIFFISFSITTAPLADEVLAADEPDLTLPADIEADRLLLKAKGALKAKNYENAVSYFEKIAQLHTQKNPLFWFHYGKSLLQINQMDKAQLAFETYLSEAGKSSEHYLEVLQYLNTIEDQRIRNQQKIHQQASLALERLQQQRIRWNKIQHDEELLAGATTWLDDEILHATQLFKEHQDQRALAVANAAISQSDLKASRLAETTNLVNSYILDTRPLRYTCTSGVSVLGKENVQYHDRQLTKIVNDYRVLQIDAVKQRIAAEEERVKNDRQKLLSAVAKRVQKLASTDLKLQDLYHASELCATHKCSSTYSGEQHNYVSFDIRAADGAAGWAYFAFISSGSLGVPNSKYTQKPEFQCTAEPENPNYKCRLYDKHAQNFTEFQPYKGTDAASLPHLIFDVDAETAQCEVHVVHHVMSEAESAAFHKILKKHNLE